MNYKNAGKCHKCPQRNDEQGCPWWWEYVQTNIATGEEKVVKQCGKAALPVFLTEVIKASNRPAAEISAMRSDIVEKVVEVAVATQNLALEAADAKLLTAQAAGGENAA